MSAVFNFFYLYDPWLFHFLRMSFLIGGVAFLWFVYKWYKKEIKQINLPIDSFIAIFALILLSVIPLLINGTKELGVITMYIKSLMLFCIGVLIYHLFYHNENGKNRLIKDVKMGISIQFFVGLLALLSVPFLADIALGTNANYFLPRFRGSEQEYRLYNLTSSAFFQLSAFYLMLLHFLLAYNHHKAEKDEKLHSIYLFFMLCIGLISGRTFFVFSILSVLLYFKRNYIPVLMLFFGLVLLLAMALPHNIYVAHALEPIINLLKVKQNLGATTEIDDFMISSSTDTLVKKHLFMPELKQFIMGDGLYYVDGNRYYGGSDSGFIRQVLYGGVGYVFVCFLFTAYFVKRIADNWFNGSLKFILSTLFLLSVLNIKADTYAFPGIMFILLMFLSLFGTSGRNRVIFCKKEK